MLVLSRKPDEEIRIGNQIVIRVVRISGSRVSLAIDAPQEFRIQRAEKLGNRPRPAVPQSEAGGDLPDLCFAWPTTETSKLVPVPVP